MPNDTARLDWLAKMMAASNGNEPQQRERAELIGHRFAEAFEAAMNAEVPAETALRVAFDAAMETSPHG